MRKKIQDLAYGRFEYEKSVPEFDRPRLELFVLQGKNYEGCFRVKSVNGIPMRGIVYSSNPRMECMTPQFEGTEAIIEFQFHSEGLAEGDVQKGDFYVAVNGGEYNLSFVASVSRFYPITSIGKVKNLFDFANLAQVSWEEAYRLYQAPCFENFFKPAETKEKMLYRALRGPRGSRQEMEEFLIGVRKKRKVLFSLEEKEKRFGRLTEPVLMRLEVRKGNWGYLQIDIKADGEFLTPQRTQLTPEQFVGNQAQVEVLIDADKLHGGKNFGRVILENLYQREVCEICVHQGEILLAEGKEGETADSGETAVPVLEHLGRGSSTLQKKLLCEITRLYLDYRMQRIVTGFWSKETCERLMQLRELYPQDSWYPLFQAQALLSNRQRQEAEWILDAFRREHKEERTPLWAFYLYLCTLWENEPSYISKKVREIQEIYHENKDSLMVFLVMLFVDDEWNNSKSRKLSAIEQRIQHKGGSPVLYMEAYYLISNDVYLLKKAGDFEMKVLYWAARNQALTKEVVDQVINLMPQVRYYHPIWYRILKACYEVEPGAGADALKALCSYCIQWSLYGPRYFIWYDKGIQEQLKLAGLYEAWIRSARPEAMLGLPKTLTMYFQYQSGLDYKQRARLYACILNGKESQKGLSEGYEKTIELFTLEQLLAGRIDENLAQLYDWVLKNGVNRQEIAKALARVLYTNKLICKDEKAVRAVVIHSQLAEEQVVPIINNQACIQLYGTSYCILLEDAHGMRYAADMDLQLKRLMQPGHYLKDCMKFEPRQLSFLIHYFEGRKTWQTFQPEDVELLLYLMESDKISTEYIGELRLLVIQYCYHSYTGEKLDAYLRQVDCEGLERDSRNKLMELMISRGIYDRAYEMLFAFGTEQAAVGKLVAVASQQIEACSYEEDKFLLALCHCVFLRGKYNEMVLRYLCRHFAGSVREMGQIYEAAREFELDTYGLEERFLARLFYTDGYFQGMSGIFLHYFDSKGQEMLILAGLSWFSYQYFVWDTLVEDTVFACIGKQLLLGNELNECCRLAYLRWLTEKKERNGRENGDLEKLLQKFIRKEMRFGFFRELPQRLLRKYHLYDKTFLEYRTNPKHKVFLSFAIEEGEEERFVEEELTMIYEGIFVKEMVVFFGEEIPYYIKEETDAGVVVTESGHIRCSDMYAQGDENRYDLINGMMVSWCLGDDATLRQLMERFTILEQTVEQEFTLL